MTLGRKQTSAHEDWLPVVAAMQADPVGTRAAAEALVDRAAGRVRSWTAGRRCVYGWSGGKDSEALRVVCEAAGVSESVLVLSRLEVPEFLAWATLHMPDGCTLIERPWDLGWLVKHPGMLFPMDAATAGKWFSGVQHWGQRRYAARTPIDGLLMGRRRADGNFTGPDGIYPDRDGFLRMSPLWDWSHEDVLRVVVTFGAFAPCYSWPRGFRVGTGSWAARQWCESIDHGWSEVNEIDPSIVAEAAAAGVPSAVRWLGR